MYHPYEDNPNQEGTANENTEHTNGTTEKSSTSYTAQSHGAAQENAYSAGASPAAGSPNITYSTSSSTQQAWSDQQTGTPVNTPPPPPPSHWQQPSYGTPSQNRGSYSWNTTGGIPQQGSYYVPPQSPKQKKKGRAGKTALKIVAGVLCCALISAGSIGAFVVLIQNGVVGIESAQTGQTAAFTINKIVEDKENTNVVNSTGQMTPQDVAAKAIPSVVGVQNYQVQEDGFMYGFGSRNGQTEGMETEVDPVGEGSGIIISEDGYIVTNAHVVEGATSLKVVTNEGLSYEAQLVGTDSQTDLAVLKIDTTDKLTVASFGSADDLQVADEVMAVGNPGGIQFNSSVTMGYVSALNRPVTNGETGYTVNCIQTDAAINPGNSGGALVDMYGNVVGINSSKIAATEYEGMGFAIPSDVVQPVVSDLIEFGYVKDRPMLGVSGQYIDSMTASFYGLQQGFYIQTATSDNAVQAGLQRGDVITAIDDTQVTSASTIANYISAKKPGEKVTLSIYRGTTGKNVQVELALTENTGE